MNENNSPFYLQVAGGQWVAVSAAFHFNLRRAVLILRKLGAVAGFMVRPMYWLSQVCVCVCVGGCLLFVCFALECFQDVPEMLPWICELHDALLDH